MTEIQKALGGSKGTLSSWLKPYPLSDEELRTRKVLNAKLSGQKYRHRRPSTAPSKWHDLAEAHSLSGDQRGKVAEAAIVLRLVTRGWCPSRPVFEGSKSDIIVENSSGLHRLQVKLASRGRHGRPTVCVRPSSRQPYKPSDFDFLVGYDIFDDIAYVLTWADFGHCRSIVALRPEWAENWDKLLGVAQR